LRNFVIIFAAAVALGSLIFTAARADDVQSKLQAAYDTQCKAFIAKDADAFKKTFDPKYSSTDLDGKHETLADIVDEVTAPTPGITVATCAFTIRKVTVNGTTATALVTATATGTVSQNGGASQPLVQVQETTDTWNVAGTPMETTSVETGIRASVGGKVVQEKGAMSTPPGGR
jgi:dihydrodipicolinate reductase